MLNMDNKQKMLLILTILFVGSLVYRLMNPYRQERVTELTYTASRPPAAAGATAAGERRTMNAPTDRMLDLFLHPQRGTAAVFRNIFEKKRPESRAAAPPMKTETAGPEPEKKTAGPYETDEGNQALGQFVAFGSFEKDGKKRIFLERRKDIFILQAGDVFDGKYRVEKITDQYLMVRSEIEGEMLAIDISELGAP